MVDNDILLDAVHGSFIPVMFVQMFEDGGVTLESPLDEDDVSKIMIEGPEGEDYEDRWGNIMEYAVLLWDTTRFSLDYDSDDNLVVTEIVT